MKISLSYKSKFRILLGSTLVLCAIGVLWGFSKYKGNQDLQGSLAAAIQSKQNSQAFLNKLNSKNADLVDELKDLVPKALVHNLESQASKLEVIKSFDKIIQKIYAQDQVSSLNNLSISDASQHLPGVSSRNISLNLTTTKASLFQLIQILENSYLANPASTFFLSINGINFNLASSQSQTLDVSLNLKLYNLQSLDLIPENE